MRKLKSCILAVWAMTWCVVLFADQNDPELDGLFERLQNAQKTEEGLLITEQIWRVWYEVHDAEASSLLDQGVFLMEQPDFRSALIAFTKLTEVKPGFAEGWNRRATLLYMMGEYNLSIQDIEKTLELEPRHFGAISGLGQIYVRQNKLIQAREAFARALKINPHLSGARVNIERIDKWLSESAI